MSRLLQQTAHLTFLGIFLIKSTIPLTILSTLATIPSTTPILVKLICISSFGKYFPQELYLSPNFRSCGISGNRLFIRHYLRRWQAWKEAVNGGLHHRDCIMVCRKMQHISALITQLLEKCPMRSNLLAIDNPNKSKQIPVLTHCRCNYFLLTMEIFAFIRYNFVENTISILDYGGTLKWLQI